MEGRDGLSSDDHDLIRRLLDETPDGPAAPAPRPVEPPPTPPEPESATFLVHDDWDRAAGAQRSTIAPAGRSWRDRLAAASPRLRHAARLTIFALAVVGALAGIGVAYLHRVGDPMADARAYYDAATRLNQGQPLYPAGADPNVADFYRYPPLLAIVLRPLALLPYWAFALLWEAIVVASLALLIRHLGVRSQRTWVAIGLLGIPIGWALSIGQAQVPLTLLLAIGQPWSIALATNLKLFPALAALWWIGRRDYEATIAFALWTGLLAIGQWILEPAGTASFFRTVGLSEVGDVRNISPYAISPQLWVVLLVVGAAVTLAAARTRWGWPIAAALATLSPPRLLVYGLTSLLACLREPVQANLPEPEPRPWLHVSGSGRH